jgi:hypothetical protein
MSTAATSTPSTRSQSASTLGGRSAKKTRRARAPAIKSIGGLVVVGLGLIAVVIVAVASLVLAREDTNAVTAITGAAFTVIGTLVGTYSGVKITSDGTRAAIDGATAQALRTQAIAIHTPSERADDIEATLRGLSARAEPHHDD